MSNCEWIVSFWWWRKAMQRRQLLLFLQVSEHFIAILNFSKLEISIWLPPAYFPPSNFYKNAFLKVESVFFSKNTLHIFFNSSKLKFFPISRKKLKLAKKPKFLVFFKNLTISVSFYGKFGDEKSLKFTFVRIRPGQLASKRKQNVCV